MGGVGGGAGSGLVDPGRDLAAEVDGSVGGGGTRGDEGGVDAPWAPEGTAAASADWAANKAAAAASGAANAALAAWVAAAETARAAGEAATSAREREAADGAEKAAAAAYATRPDSILRASCRIFIEAASETCWMAPPR